MKNQIITRKLVSAKDTEDLAALLGSRLRGGECFELLSDIGGGKTTFTRGLVAGTGSTDVVSSPTFTIGKQYKSPLLSFYHFDFYRLADPGLVAEELVESLEDPKGVIIVEWAQTVAAVLPSNRIQLRFDKVSDNPDARILKITCPEDRSYLIEGLA